MPVLPRFLATLALLAGIGSIALYLFANAPAGTFGVETTFLTGVPAAHVDRVSTNGPAYQAGIRAGDLIASASTANSDRFALYLFANPPIIARGDVVTVSIHRGSYSKSATMTAMRDEGSPRFEAVYFTVLAIPILLLGWFIVWRKPLSGDARILGAMLLLLGLWIATPDRVGSPPVRLACYEILSTAFVIFAVLCAAIFFARYPEGRGLNNPPLRMIAIKVSLIATVLELVSMFMTYALPPYWGAQPWLAAPTIIVALVPIVAALVCLLYAFRRGDAQDGTRLRWLGGAFFVGFSGPLCIPGAYVILGPKFSVIHQVLFESTLFVLAFGLTYAILRRRVVDVAFVLNRALIFSVVSTIVVALFLTVEWFLGSALIASSRATSFLIEAGAAVLIGFSLRPIHARVDRAIDRLLFAKRHAAETALNRLATEVNFIRDRSTLITRLQRDLMAYLEVDDVAVYYRDDARADFMLLASTTDQKEFLSADDDAAVALAVEEEPIDLHRHRTSLVGELAVPLAVRKALVGILILGPKRCGEAFAPDEIEPLRFLAGYLGGALAATAGDAKLGEDSASLNATLNLLLSEVRSQRADLISLKEQLANGGARSIPP